MRLFLSSESLGNYPEMLSELVGGNKKLAYVGNAKDDWPEEDRTAKAAEHNAEFEAQGFKFEEIDLRDYFGKPDKLLNKLSNFGLVWLSGGNTFILRWALAYSGMDKIISDLVKKDQIVYGGSSAGSIIATPSLHGTELGDDPHAIPEGYKRKIIWKGLNLVPFYIVPHYKSEWFGAEAESMMEYFVEHKLPHKALQDRQAIVVNGLKEEFLK